MYKEFQDTTVLFGANAPFVEELYEHYLADPDSVPEEWRHYFDALRQGPGPEQEVPHAPIRAAFECLIALAVASHATNHRTGAAG